MRSSSERLVLYAQGWLRELSRSFRKLGSAALPCKVLTLLQRAPQSFLEGALLLWVTDNSQTAKCSKSITSRLRAAAGKFRAAAQLWSSQPKKSNGVRIPPESSAASMIQPHEEGGGFTRDFFSLFKLNLSQAEAGVSKPSGVKQESSQISHPAWNGYPNVLLNTQILLYL